MEEVYPTMGPWEREEYEAQLARFPDGQIGIELGGRVIAASISIIVDHSTYTRHHTYDKVTARGTFENHDPKGDALYGIDMFVSPDHRNLRLGRRMYDARKELVRQLNLRGIIVGGRVPGYQHHSEELSPQEYVEQVRGRELFDPILSFQLANEFQIRRVLVGYNPEDRASRSCAVLLEWVNIYYEGPTEEPLITTHKRVIRLGAVQWQMRPTESVDEFLDQCEFFVDALAAYNADFALFPELFNVPLLGHFDQSKPPEAMRQLAGFTEEIRSRLLQLAVSYNINIVGGSMPVYDGHALRNVAFLLRRDGTWASQEKIHITPDERSFWGLSGGNRLEAFETDVGTVGILICYDVEFPELPRILRDRGIDLLFVPFWTDTRNGYIRVRHCAQARAVENECYVAIAGSVGNLPKVENAEIQYAQSAVFTPADFQFPHDAILAETTPNTEMTLIADLDLDKLLALREEGGVRNGRDRRLDLYRVDWIGPNGEAETSA
ncbi:MAG: GNAT family N-acetyltransferase [Planctomycetes bacterium]|nr:GNAT family N-acetyltransferase [Planctomycetota bacterium]